MILETSFLQFWRMAAPDATLSEARRLWAAALRVVPS
jgi:hypothetical protein